MSIDKRLHNLCGQTISAPDWARYIAQDPDGSCWAYEAEPHIHDNGWYENEIGRVKKIGAGEPNKTWQTSLQLIGK